MTPDQMRGELADCREQVAHAHQHVREIRESTEALDLALTAAKASIKSIDTALHASILHERETEAQKRRRETPANASTDA